MQGSEAMPLALVEAPARLTGPPQSLPDILVAVSPGHGQSSAVFEVVNAVLGDLARARPAPTYPEPARAYSSKSTEAKTLPSEALNEQGSAWRAEQKGDEPRRQRPRLLWRGSRVAVGGEVGRPPLGRNR